MVLYYVHITLISLRSYYAMIHMWSDSPDILCRPLLTNRLAAFHTLTFVQGYVLAIHHHSLPFTTCLKRLVFFTLFQSVILTKTLCGKSLMAAICAALSFVVVCHLSKSITLCLLRLLCSLHDASMSSRSWMEGKNSLSQQDVVAEAWTANFSVVEKTLHHWAIFPFCHLHFILRFDTSFKETA